jgi:hypothetical protein
MMFLLFCALGHNHKIYISMETTALVEKDKACQTRRDGVQMNRVFYEA